MDYVKFDIGHWRRAQRGKPWLAEIAHNARQIRGALHAPTWTLF
jgi:hypothetical protein